MRETTRTTLRVKACSFQEAQFATRNFHYTGTTPTADAKFFGVWEDEHFIGAVIFGSGTARMMPAKFGLKPSECCELTRVALKAHKTPVSRIVAVAMRLLKIARPDLKLIYSYADPAQNHHGGIYQALNFIYTGSSAAQRELLIDGKYMHKRTAFSRWGTSAPAKITAMTGLSACYGEKSWKHCYFLPLCDQVRKQLEAMRQPYPKRALN